MGVQATDERLTIDYSHTSNFNSDEGVQLVYDENLIRFRADSFGTVLTGDSVNYNAMEVVFHTPAEHSISSTLYDMEVQIIHKATTDGHIGEKLVIVLLFRQTDNYAAANTFINKHMDNWAKIPSPDPYNREKIIKEGINIADFFNTQSNATGDLGQLITNIEFPYYSYDGSLTYPPCDEKTRVIVNKNVQLVSASQL